MNLINELKNILNIDANSSKNEKNMSKNENLKNNEFRQFEFSIASPFINMLRLNENGNNQNISNNNTNSSSESSSPKPQINNTNHIDGLPKCPIDNSGQREKFVKLRYLIDDSSYLDKLHHNTHIKVSCNADRCMGSLLQATKTPHVKKSKEEIMKEAVDLINQFYASVKRFFIYSFIIMFKLI